MAGRRIDRVFRAGAVLWICTLQYFIVEAVVIRAWPGRYSLARNVISDLGALGCHRTGPHPVCSPLHWLMNLSFGVQGVLIAGGALTMWACLPRHSRFRAGFLLVALAGPGVLLAGLFPEDTLGAVHYAGAADDFLFFTLGAFAFAHAFLRTEGAGSLRGWLSLAVALCGAVGMALLVTGIDAGLGRGVIERITADPFPVWLAILGLSFLWSRRAVLAGPEAPARR